MKRINVMLFLIIFLSANISLVFGATNEGYGEDSQSLGQFIDTYTSLDNVTVNINTIRNATFNAMELNYTAYTATVLGDPYLREHDIYAGKTPEIVFTIGGGDYVELRSGNTPQGHGIVYLYVDRQWMNGKYLRWKWNGYYSGASLKQILIMYGIDAQWDRTDDNHFPEGGRYGQQLEFYPITAFKGWSGWKTQDYQFNNVSGGSSDIMTIAFVLNDAWASQNLRLLLDWIEINGNASGADNIIYVDFNGSTPRVMEQTGTQDDYGYIDDTTWAHEEGGYVANGYFLSTDYLSSPIVNGSTIVHMLNTSLPTGTDITIEFSDDNATWVLNDWQPIFGGFESIDLRELNYSTGYYTRHNLSTAYFTVTPRVYQSRLITTIGNSTGGNGGGGPVVGGGINSATIIMLIFICGLAFTLLWRYG